MHVHGGVFTMFTSIVNIYHIHKKVHHMQYIYKDVNGIVVDLIHFILYAVVGFIKVLDEEHVMVNFRDTYKIKIMQTLEQIFKKNIGETCLKT